ncbi:MAG: UDP-3-O-acyl-N-acetylglucosamine deacetylase [Hydrogenothermaceae bacterium]|nr:UDP-3-O-acyl-N-acetylglucosamine deacetylase [Hydrogenothermaceae bacterium]
MICQFQRTIKNPIKIEGVGLHSGENTTLYLIPAKENEGIKFIKDGVVIPAHIDNAHSFEYSTTLYKEGKTIRTVEHLMAALYFTGIDNITIEIAQGEELPILDGSSKVFVEKIKEAGIVSLPQEKIYAVIEEPIEIFQEDKFIKATPSNRFKVIYQANYNNSIIGNKKFEYIPENIDSFKGIYTARTYCFLEEVEYLRSKGLAKGGSLENAVVFDKDKVLNEEGLRFEDEPIRHKTLDLIGDLYLLGYPIIGEIFSFKGGHRLNAEFVKALISQGAYSLKQASEIIEIMNFGCFYDKVY